ncbi:hypothetical protein AAHL06_002760 [Vibrio parahaemolyticus]|uniref:Uncharacterized protein n=1 Tax=Vibrio parahaemolyticus TaxID=670 RepID=A0AAX0M4C3_VIBPH|nr:hypothetical protein [Vibrio parahaemolyticus]EGR5854860.1 hypothetical protein [Vibrio parahaemolyticus]EJE4165111.1 hypothetical protein [Vibrio parahaemolyticus]EJG0040892.1 hypothetical protein [Vibrio parahaemolyticus]EJR0961418.1 hypothetical protein [Vibrio parahaemolyticus]ELA9389097.1 hypothetical protein [Vibrio parahaemolyticus]
MKESVELGFLVVDKYRAENVFFSSFLVPNNHIGAAEYLAWVAYPKDKKHRAKFRNAMLNAAINDYCKRRSVSKYEKIRLLNQHGISKDMIWRDIDIAITGGTEKVGGGTKKLIDRLHAYHVFRAYDKSLENEANLSFGTVLEKISRAYESEYLKSSDIESRINSFKRIFRQSRPVLHLTWGMVDSFISKGWANENGQLCYGVKPAILDPSWLPEALEKSKMILGLQLVENFQGKSHKKNLRDHKFDAKEIIDIDLLCK